MKLGSIGIWEVLIILVAVLLIFGPRRLPEMAKGIGQSVREFRKGLRDMKNDFEVDIDEKPRQPKGSTTAAATTSESPVETGETKGS